MRLVKISILWALFVFLQAAMAYLLLSACDLGQPLFGFRYCKAPPAEAPGSLLREQERRADLRDRLRQAQLQLARKPICALPVKEALSAPEPIPSPQPEPRQQTKEVMKFPEKIEDLKGCWQSERGDIDVVADTPEQKPWGKVRICFCFGTNGRGSIRYRFFEGDRCLGPLSARIDSGKLFMQHPKLRCRTHGYIVAEDIACARDSNGAAACNKKEYGRFLTGEVEDENYRRVDEGYCDTP